MNIPVEAMNCNRNFILHKNVYCVIISDLFIQQLDLKIRMKVTRVQRIIFLQCKKIPINL